MIAGPRGRAAAAAIVAALLLAFAALWGIRQRQAEAQHSAGTAASPDRLLLLTSLPLLFGEDFSVDGNGSRALDALQRHYRVVPISVASTVELAKGRLLLMAQPSAQPAENLVALDQWVRDGGRVMVLADPLLEWPSRRPLGDPLRPAPMFADTGLLGHWGLRLDAPDQRGPALRRLGGHEVEANSPGTLSGNCDISGDWFVARCRIGRGQAIVIADADFLNVEDLDGPTDHNLDSVIAELESLER